MEEAYVRLLCPACRKEWESAPGDLPAPEDDLSCPDCDADHRVSEFMRTEHDLQTLKRLR
jgi:hypothetical protein